jgi:hypothetical protein
MQLGLRSPRHLRANRTGIPILPPFNSRLKSPQAGATKTSPKIHRPSGAAIQDYFSKKSPPPPQRDWIWRFSRPAW